MLPPLDFEQAYVVTEGSVSLKGVLVLFLEGSNITHTSDESGTRQQLEHSIRPYIALLTATKP
jgi:hypothetical protein